MRHLLTQEIEKLAKEQQLRPAPLPVASSWRLANRATTVELCWNPQAAQRTVQGEGGFGHLLGIATSKSPRYIQVRRAVQATGASREGSALQQLSEDAKLLADSLVRTGEDSWARVLGYYRTIPGGPADFLRPTAEDERTIRECCSTAPGLVLLLQGYGDQARGALYLWDESGLDYTSPMFFSLSTATAPPFVAASAEGTAAVPAVAAPAQPLETEPRSTASHSNRKPLLIGILCGILLALTAVTAYFAGQARNAKSTPPAEPPASARPAEAVDQGASLKVEAAGGALQIRWNSQSPAIQSCDNGFLYIVDGKDLKSIPLSGDELRTGFMLYQPTNAQLTIGLAGVKAGRSVVQTVISVSAPSATKGAPATFTARLPAAGQPLAVATQAEVRQRDPLPVAAASPAFNPPQLAREEPVAPPPTRPMVTAPPQTSESAKPPRSEPALPPWMFTAAAPVEVPLNVPSQLALTPQAPPIVQQPATSVKTPAKFVPARPRNLNVPPADHYRRLLVRSVRIAVTVQLDASGKVISAIADMPNSVIGGLASLAIASAKSCLYEPARRDGVPVASELILLFNFEKK